MIAVLACIIPSFRLFCQRKTPDGSLICPGSPPHLQERFHLFNSGKSWIFLCIGPEIFPLYPKPLAPGSAGGLFHMCSRMQQKGRSLQTVPLAYRKDIERYREKRDISFPSCAAASDRHPERTPAYRSPTASADSHRRWRGYRVWWASPAAGACRAPREW